jgi:8-oxo-dGTP diphosphatase
MDRLPCLGGGCPSFPFSFGTISVGPVRESVAGTNLSVAGIAWDAGRFFIARRVSGGAMGDKWEFPGGKVEEGESCEVALNREYREEFAVGIRIGAFLGSADFEHRGIPRVVKAYRIFFADTADLRSVFKLSEHTQWRWASLDEIEGLDDAGAFVDSDRRLLPTLKTASFF